MKVKELKLNPKNPRRISPDHLAKLTASIQNFPKMMELRPIVYDPETMQVLGGNQRLQAIKNLKMTEIPDSWVKSAADLTPEEKKEFIIKDNVPLGEWDFEALEADFAEFDFAEMGIEIPEIHAGDTAEVQDDDYEEPEQITTDIQYGDIYSLMKDGKEIHRLMCGDSTKKDDVDKLMDNAIAEIMVTDPPYGVNYDAEWRVGAGLSKKGTATGKVTNDNNATWTTAYELSQSQVAYVYHAGVKTGEVLQNLIDAGYDPINLIIWNKNSLVIGMGNYHHKHEPIWYCVKSGKNHLWAGSRTETTVWDIDKNMKNETGHSTQKPVECMAKPIRNHTAKTVYDPFIGSGTTMVAAHQLGRKCYGMEIEPTYCQIVIDRMRKLDPDLEIKINGEIQKVS